MELDRLTLQLIFNVVTVTIATSLTLICYLLKSDNQKLTAELKRRRERDRLPLEIVTPQVSRVPEPPASKIEPVAALNAPPVVQQDIRQFVAKRAQGWMLVQATKS